MAEKDSGKKPLKLITTAQFAEMKPEEVAACVVTKRDFIQLTSLREMEPQAAEDTYQRWLVTKRVVETREVKQDPTGEKEDEVTITIEARYVNSERRRVNINKREVAKAKALLVDTLPPAMRD